MQQEDTVKANRKNYGEQLVALSEILARTENTRWLTNQFVKATLQFYQSLK